MPISQDGVLYDNEAHVLLGQPSEAPTKITVTPRSLEEPVEIETNVSTSQEPLDITPTLTSNPNVNWTTDSTKVGAEIGGLPESSPSRDRRPEDVFGEVGLLLKDYPADVARRALGATEKTVQTLKNIMDGKVAANSEEGIKAITEAAGFIGTGGLATAPMRAGVGTFGGQMGRMAAVKTHREARAIFGNEELANAMRTRNFSEEQIYDATGLFKGKDGYWKHSINDDAAQLINIPFSKNNTTIISELKDGTTLGDILHHPELFKQYPDLKSLPIYKVPDEAAALGYKGWVPADGKSLVLSDQTSDEFLSTLLHEVQHLIQKKEGFARGGNPEEFLPKGFSKIEKISKDAEDQLKIVAKDVDVDVQDGLSAVKVKQHLEDIGEQFPPKPDQARLKAMYLDEIIAYEKLMQNPEALQTFETVGSIKDVITRYKIKAYQDYQNLAGEVEARLVQSQYKALEKLNDLIAKNPAILTNPKNKPFLDQYLENVKYPFKADKTPKSEQIFRW